MQNDDGGFAFWDKGQPSVPYLGIYVANALAHAKAKGYAVPPQMLARSLAYLKAIDSHVPAFYGPGERLALEAFALSTRKLLGDVDPRRPSSSSVSAVVSTAGRAWPAAPPEGGRRSTSCRSRPPVGCSTCSLENPAAAAERKALLKLIARTTRARPPGRRTSRRATATGALDARVRHARRCRDPRGADRSTEGQRSDPEDRHRAARAAAAPVAGGARRRTRSCSSRSIATSTRTRT